jgi:CRISPR/Cas system-associated exonuclease Cas4 (RecB family)
MQPHEIKWSYSGLKDYVNCPRQYQEVKVLKRYEKRPTQQMLYGTAVHGALEDYVGKGTPLPKNYQQYQKQLDPLKDMGGIKFPEHRMAVTFDRTPCTFGAKEYWVRGIADLLVIDGKQAYIVDYKTGSNKYPDPKQLQLMSLLTFAHFPQVQHVKAGLLFVVHEHFVTSEYAREDSEKLWNDFIPDLERLRLSHVNDSWQPNPTPLCGWCPVSSCEFNKQR